MTVNLDYLLFYPAGKLWAASLIFGALFLARSLVYAPQIQRDNCAVDERVDASTETVAVYSPRSSGEKSPERSNNR
jgi:hypothetical protein